MFAVCFVVGNIMFAQARSSDTRGQRLRPVVPSCRPASVSQVRLREYAVFVGALAATLAELYEPLGLNDNMTIPVVTALALEWGFARVSGV